jgi:hypothetical protein
LLLAVICLLLWQQEAWTQSKSNPAAGSQCNSNDTIESIQQQVDVAKLIDDRPHRIAVLIRAADLLWTLKREPARTVFADAFELARQIEKEKEDERRESWKAHRSVLLMEIEFHAVSEDQRDLVIRAVSKRDSGWAKKLIARVLEEDRQLAEQSPNKDSFHNLLTANRLLFSATGLVSSDQDMAIDLARASLRYPATDVLSRFLYTLAAVDQRAADQLYSQALAAYADRPMREFLYLATYPFAFRSSGDTPVFGFYDPVISANFAVNSSVQRQFTLTLLRRAQQALEVPLDATDDYNGLSGAGHIRQTLIRIEPYVKERLPDLLDAVIQTREKIFVSLTAETQNTIGGSGQNEASAAPTKTFDERIESAEKTLGVNQRDDLIAEAILSSASAKETVDSLIRATNQISHSDLREALVEWIYFRQAQEAVRRKQFDEAEKLAKRVEGHEQRSFLMTEIARGLTVASNSSGHAAEILDQAIAEANKAEMKTFAARALLTISNLYTRIDTGRSLTVLAAAINCINHIEAPDFVRDDRTLVRTISRKSNTGGRFIVRFYLPGLDPEAAFRELAGIDFNDAFSQTNALDDKFQRALATLAVAEVCLQESQRREKSESKKTKPQT